MLEAEKATELKLMVDLLELALAPGWLEPVAEPGLDFEAMPGLLGPATMLAPADHCSQPAQSSAGPWLVIAEPRPSTTAAAAVAAGLILSVDYEALTTAGPTLTAG